MTTCVHQRGIVLASTLAFVLAMTVAALAAGNIAGLEQQLARNVHRSDSDFAAAESAIASVIAGEFTVGIGRTVTVNAITVTVTYSGFQTGECDADDSTTTGLHHFNLAAAGVHRGIAFCAARDFGDAMDGGNARDVYWRHDGV